MTVAEYQQARISRLLEDETGEQKFIDSLVPSMRRREKVNIVKLLQVWSPLLPPDRWKRLARVLYIAAKQAGVRIIDDALPGIPSAEWVEEWITTRLSST